MLKTFPLKPLFEYIRRHRVMLVLFFILIIGSVFKLTNFSELVRFNADQVRDTRVIETIAETGEFPLLGPKAGGTAFKLGPAFYYLEYFSASLFGMTPEGIALIFPLLGVASIGLFFLLFRRFFPVPLALGLTALYATAFYFTKYSRFAWNPNAIPFFLIAFFLLVLLLREAKGRQRLFYYGALGLVMGIGMQLHTTLLLLTPAVFLAAHIRLALEKNEYFWREFLVTAGLVLLCHSPFFLSDFQNAGANIRSFFAGMTAKTEENHSASGNLALNAQFFIQGTTYALSGMEPDKDWTKLKSYTSMPSLRELMLGLGGVGFFAFGLFLLARRFRSETDKPKKDFLELMIAVAGLSFVLFLPIANELNLRFFIVLLVLPYLFLGLIGEEVLRRFADHRRTASAAIIALFALIILTNTRMVIRTYDLDNYRVKDQVYGGLSLGEGKRLAGFIAETNRPSGNGSDRVIVYPFEFERSLEYLLEPYQLRIEEIEEDQARTALRYLITENKKTEAARKKLDCCFTSLREEHVGRFTISALAPKADPLACRIGFITDIHATRSKETPFIGLGSYDPLLAFMDTMEKKFQPDVLVENGDFIDGSETSNERALEVYRRTKKIYDRSGIPTLHVMGNHETRSGGITTEQWLAFAGQDRTYYSETCKNTEIIVLDGNNDALRDSMNETDRKALEKTYFIDSDQFAWLEATLAAAKDRQKIVFIHEPLFPRAEITPNIKPEKDLRDEDVERLQKLFREHSVAAVISGHVESLFHSTVGGTEHFILPGVRKSADLAVQWLGSFAEIVVGSDGEIALNFMYRKGWDKPYESVFIPSRAFQSLEK